MASVATDAGARSHFTMDNRGVVSNVLPQMFAISVLLLMNLKDEEYKRLVESDEILGIQVTVKTDEFPDGETQSVAEWLLQFGKSKSFLTTAGKEIFWNHSLGGNYTVFGHAIILHGRKQNKEKRDTVIDKVHFIHIVVTREEATTVGYAMLIADLEQLLSDKSSTKA